MKSERKEILIDFIPFLVSVAATTVCFLIYFFALHKSYWLDILKGCTMPLVTLAIPFINLIFKVRIPIALNAAVAAFAFCGIDLASVLGFYGFPYYDKFLHTSFGALGAFGVFILLLYGKGERMRPWCFFLVIFLSVLGLAALWEIYEYASGAILDYDMQHWMPDLSQVGDMSVSEFFAGYDPLWDTIWDIIVAAFGVIVFYLILLLDRLNKYRTCKRIYRQVNFRRGRAEKEKKI